MIHKGASFILCGSGNHLRAIVSEPNADGEVLVCNITDYDNDPDCRCVITPGEHARISKLSVIALRRLLILSVDGILLGHKNGQLVFCEDFSAELIVRMCAVILESPDVAPKFKRKL
jgi:hypothetical protein